MQGFFDTKIEFLKGVGPQKAALLNKELNIFTYGDLIQYYPFRHEDRTKFYDIKEVNGSMPYIQVKGKVRHYELKGPPRKQRLIVYINDGTGELELVWFKGAQWMLKKIQPGVEYVVFGKPTVFGSKLNLAHPEIEVATQANTAGGYLQPVYSSTDLLRRKYLDSKAISKLIKTLLDSALPKLRETMPAVLLEQYALLDKQNAIANIHFPKNLALLNNAQFRLKFEELFYVQIRLLKLKLTRIDKFRGISFDNADLLNEFYTNHLPFDLTNAQKRVIKEIYKDMRSGKQMNRLLQGDVGSGKTIVAFICLLIAIGSDTQGAIMAPTEILATQHYTGLKEFADKMGLRIALLTGSTKKSERKIIHEYLKSGELHILVGTHALLEEVVQFKKLGLAIVDEQHRFGVAQRSKLWQKNTDVYPHVLVMTATPIPRTLAMTLYGDLDISVIDELPAGRKPIKTVHRYDSNRLKVNSFLKEQIDLGRQVYVVYPLIEESEKLDLKDLMDGYESIARAFPEIPLSIVHGKMKPDAKEWEMQRFVKGETKIMVATTVIEVGVNVPNASVMVIENAERFGLAQLHQLRGRVGRGADQSYCILISGFKLSKEARTRIETMVRTNNGFEIADTDLQLRGPGDLMGTQQSGVLDLLIADLGKDGKILQSARQAAQAVLNDDPNLSEPKNSVIKTQIASMKKTAVNWSRIS
ncbi:ATP-dependent DNA helicase RecG [Fulvivirga lutea]|uniref:ATP-dependent DNA helicase RecG n=1 Tax=Fulvivirga lutea TaxID=2810512 RepID=A0A974WGN2_9BACT|nr:ATP-dependent DNA helicase RecG [Fulvivirga lutea]QSE97966.1 ATP-dependent DNA helicase RecG [Fulvivirga lutea]